MTMCAYKGGVQPCVAEAKPGNARNYCGPHEAMLMHDYALAFRRRQRRHTAADAERWAATRGLDVATLQEAGAKMTDTTRPLTVKAVSDVDAL
jgi:hypothetical protein